MANFLLLHGSWHGGWCWDGLAALLRAAGNRVLAPDLLGLGARAHLGNAATTLSAQFRDLAQSVAAADHWRVVAHSSAGMVLALLCDHWRGALAAANWLDAIIPQDGLCLLAEQPDGGARIRARAIDGWQIPPPRPEVFGLTAADPLMPVWHNKLVAQPLGTYTEPIRLRDDWWQHTAHRYAHCVAPNFHGALDASARLAQARGWPVTELATGHLAMATAPALVRDWLLA